MLQERDMDLDSLLCQLMEEGQSHAQATEAAAQEQFEEKPLIEAIDQMPTEEEKHNEGNIRIARKRCRV